MKFKRMVSFLEQNYLKIKNKLFEKFRVDSSKYLEQQIGKILNQIISVRRKCSHDVQLNYHVRKLVKRETSLKAYKTSIQLIY